MDRPEKGYEPVFSDDASASSFDDFTARVAPERNWVRKFGLYILHASLIATYSAIFLVSLRFDKSHVSVFGLLDSPAKDAGETQHQEIFPIQGPPHGIYTGEPSEDVDKAWRDLLQYNNIRVSDDWVHRHERENEAVKLPDGGYLGMLSVFHELHCIKRLYQTLTPEHYFPNATKEELLTNREHNKHCLEVLRMGASCRGDVSIITHMWTDIDSQPIVNQTAPHQCIDFDKVVEYSRDNAVDVFQENYIVHPVFGPSFPKGNSIKPFEEQHHHHM